MVLWMGIIVSFLQTQVLLERASRDHYVEFGVFINIGIPRGIVALMVSLEYIGYAAIGGILGIGCGILAVLAASVGSRFVLPTVLDARMAGILAVLVPCAAGVPVGLQLFYRLLGERRGIGRVR